jgi:small-conductance mechanosensitive channel
MEAFNSEIYPVAILLFIFIALFIVVFFRLFKYLIPFFRLQSSRAKFVKKYLPVSELTVWVLFLTWSTQYLFNRGYVLAWIPLLIFIIAILFLAWFGLKDIMAGIIFKTAHTLQLRDHISVAGISGKVTAIKQSTIEIEDQTGRIISIPFSKITGNILLRQYPSQSLLSHNFRISISNENITDGVFELIENLRITILTLPWASQKKEPKISVEEEYKEDILFNITVFSLDEGYFPLIEKHLEKKYKGKVLK